MKNKKGLSTIITLLLLVFMVIAVGGLITSWYFAFTSEYRVSQVNSLDLGSFEILDLKRIDSSSSQLGLRIKDRRGEEVMVSGVFLGEFSCEVLDSSGEFELLLLRIDCPVSLGETYELRVVLGVSKTRTLTVASSI